MADNEDDGWNQQSPSSSSSPTSSLTADIASSNPAFSKMLAATVVSAFTDKLKAGAREHWGILSASHVDQLSQEFESRQDKLEKVCGLAFNQLTSARNWARFDHARERPFDRTIVNTFADLFGPARVIEDGETAITQRILLGFFIAI